MRASGWSGAFHGVEMTELSPILVRDPKWCVLHERGALVTIRRAPFDAQSLAELGAVITEVASGNPRGIVMLTAYRLDRRFRLDLGLELEFPKYAEALRAVDRHVSACASVIEFDGVRAAFMRAAFRAVTRLARPTTALATFDGVVDAAQWLAPRGGAVGAAGDVASYVGAYRQVDRELRAIDLP